MNLRKTIVGTLAAILLPGGQLLSQSTQDVDLTAVDGVVISGTFTRPEAVGSTIPTVILIHQAGSTRAEWDGLVPRLIAAGYATFAYDVRGHGASGQINGGVSTLFNNPDLAPADLAAVLNFLRATGEIDPERIGVVGASVGANLAAMATGRFGVKTAVAISAKESAVFALGGQDGLVLRSVFYNRVRVGTGRSESRLGAQP